MKSHSHCQQGVGAIPIDPAMQHALPSVRARPMGRGVRIRDLRVEVSKWATSHARWQKASVLELPRQPQRLLQWLKMLQVSKRDVEENQFTYPSAANPQRPLILSARLRPHPSPSTATWSLSEAHRALLTNHSVFVDTRCPAPRHFW